MQNNSNKSDKPEWQNIAETQSEHELSQGHTFWLWAYRIGVGGSFTALAIFIVERMAGTSAQIWEYTGGQALNALVGLIFAFAFSAFVYAFYLSSYSIKQRLFVFSVAVLFPLFAEVSQTMHRGEESQKVSSEASPEFLAAQKALAAMTGANPAAGNAGGLAAAAGEKAKHEAELKACSRYESATRREKCQRYEMGKIAEADGKVQGYTASGNAALTAHQGNLTSMIGTIKELGNNQDHAHSMVKLFMEMGVSLLVASLIMAVLIIGSIETALAWLGEHVKNYQKAMRARGLEIGNQKKAVVKAYRPESSPTLSNESAPVSAFAPLADSAKQTVAEFAKKVEQGLKSAPEIVATEYARADFANKQVLADAGRIGGKIGAKLDDALNAANRKNHPQKIQFPVGEGKTADDYDLIPRTDKTPTLSGENTIAYLTPRLSVTDTVKQIQASVKASGATSPAAIQAAVFDAFAGMTNPAPLSDSILERIAGKMAEKAIPTASPSVPFRQQSGATGIHNPVLGTEEEHFPLPLPSTVTTVPVQSKQTPHDVQSEQPVHAVTTVPVQSGQSETAELTGAAKQAETDLYPAWLALVQSKEMTAGARDAKRFISQSTKNGADEYGLTIQEMQRIWASWQDRAANDGVLTANPKYQQGNRQAKYLLAA